MKHPSLGVIPATPNHSFLARVRSHAPPQSETRLALTFTQKVQAWIYLVRGIKGDGLGRAQEG